MSFSSSPNSSLDLYVGETVEVLSESEIMKTLDQYAACEGLPFMPEMLRFSGKTFTVFKRADKVNDMVERSGLRRMKSAVILDGVRCDGRNHGGCEAGCQILWKESWLRRAPRQQRSLSHAKESQKLDGSRLFSEKLQAATEKCSDGAAGQGRTYRCQATDIRKASSFLHPCDVRQYVRDVRFGNVGLLKVLSVFAVWAFNGFQRARKGIIYPAVAGTQDRTPRGGLNLQPGDVVRIKSKEEIGRTLDRKNRTSGLWFDPEMVKYCGGTFRVLRRVSRIIDEKTGKLLMLKSDCLILEGVTTLGDYHRFYSQNEYIFWREAWLTRAD